jgi:phosphate transport system permease protein
MSPVWKVPAPTPAQMLGTALVRAVVAALAVSLIVAIIKFLAGAVQGGAADVASLITQAGELALMLFVPFVAIALIAASRALQDRAFVYLGFLATFFGLAMLVIFFWRIGVEVSHWFHYTPQLVQAQNVELAALGERTQNAQKMLDEELAKVRLEMEAALANSPDAEKAELRKIYEEEVIPQKRADLIINIEELSQTARGNLRPDTSSWGILMFFLSNGPSNEAQDAGIYPAILGSLWVGLITIVFAVPVGVAAALYLEEYKHNNRLGRLIQVNINNLAGVPSVVYGILGAFVFVELIFKPLENQFPGTFAARNVLGGGLTLGLLTLPVVIVAAQEAIRAVPDSIRQGAYALGATHWQVIWHSVLPMARPGILTGTILSLSRAVGEAAPLVLFGALLFVNQDPSLFSRFTVLPMQIFGWADRPAVTVNGETVEIWKYNAALASLVLLVMLLTMNGLAIFLRNRAQKSMRL